MPPRPYARRGADAGVVARDLDRQERLVFLQQRPVGGRVDELLEGRVHPGDLVGRGPRHGDLRRHGGRRARRLSLAKTASPAAPRGLGVDHVHGGCADDDARQDREYGLLAHRDLPESRVVRGGEAWRSLRQATERRRCASTGAASVAPRAATE